MVFAFHDGEEIGPRMLLARIARNTGLKPEDLCTALTERIGLLGLVD